MFDKDNLDSFSIGIHGDMVCKLKFCLDAKNV